MKMIFTALAVLAVTGSVLTQRNPNPCEGVADGGFANDWASCPSYFWCRAVAAGGPTPTTPCNDGLGFDPVALTCNTQALTDCEAGTGCPATGTIAVGDATDTACRRYFFCIESVRTTEPLQCGPGTRFNRVTGMCDLEANVRCFGAGGVGTPSESCTVGGVGITGDVNSEATCASFIPCVNGIAGAPIQCSTGMHFNPKTSQCDLPANLVPPCTDPATVASSYTKTVPQDYSPAPTFKDRILARLHL